MILNNQTFVMLTEAYNAAFDRGFAGFGVDQDWSKVASLENSGTGSEIYPFVGHWPKMREWIGDRHVKNLEQYGYQLANRLFEDTVDVRRVDIEDDKYGVYSKTFQTSGAAAKVWPDDLVFGGDPIYVGKNPTPNIGGAAIEGATNLCYDGHPFFYDSHPMGSTTASNYDDTTGTVNNTGGNLWMMIDNSKPIMPFVFQLRESPKITARMLDTDPKVFDKDLFTWGIRSRGAAGYSFWQLAFGSLNDIDLETVMSYWATIEGLKSDQGYKLGVSPQLIVAGPSLRRACMDTFDRQFIPDPLGGSLPVSNPLYKKINYLITPHLT